MRIYTLALAVLGLVTQHVDARPVSYPGGWTLMSMNDGNRRSAHLHYSPTVKTSIGYKFEDWHDRDFRINAVQVNRLLQRWNQKESQANIYLKSGIGAARSDFGGSEELAAFTGLALDWEDRRYFVAYENRYTHAGDIDAFYQQTARIGWAPYEGDYGDLHTWLMLEARHMPESRNTFTVTPMARLFKDVHMVEIGISNHGDVMFNYIFRY